VATVGIDFRTKIMTFGSTVVKVQIFDTAGQERFHTITQAYYRNAAGALIVFDITNQASFRNIGRWLTDMDAQAAQAVKIIIGSKCDLEDSRSVSRSQANKYAEEVSVRYLECSAMTGQNVEEAFNSTIHSILIKRGILTTASAPSPSDSSSPPSRKNSLVQLKDSDGGETKENKDTGCC